MVPPVLFDTTLTPETEDPLAWRTDAALACGPAPTRNPDWVDEADDRPVLLADTDEDAGVVGREDNVDDLRVCELIDGEGVVSNVEDGECDLRDDEVCVLLEVGVVLPLLLVGIFRDERGERGRVGLWATSLLDLACLVVPGFNN